MADYVGYLKLKHKTRAGGTHVFDMIKRLRENENLKKKNYFKKTKDTYKRTSKSINVDYKTATKEEREEIRAKISAARKWEIKKSLMILIFSVVVIVTLILLLLKYVGP